MGSLCPLQAIFPTQGLNPGLPHFRWILYQLSHQGSPLTSIIITNFQTDFIHIDRDWPKQVNIWSKKRKELNHKNRGKGRNWVRPKWGKVNKQRNALSLSWCLKGPGKERRTGNNWECPRGIGWAETLPESDALWKIYISGFCLVGPQNLWVGRSQTLYLPLSDAEMSLRCFPLKLKIGYPSITKLMKFHTIQSKIENGRQVSASLSFFLPFLPSFFFFSFFWLPRCGSGMWHTFFHPRSFSAVTDSHIWSRSWTWSKKGRLTEKWTA